MNVCYFGPLRDYSGYGEANRHAIAALHTAGINVVARGVAYTMEAADFGPIGNLINQLTENQADYRVKILHTTPDVYKRYIEDDKYHIGHFFWETDKVPPAFAEGLKLMDEIWTGSQANVDAMRNAGIENQIYIFPQAIETDRDFGKPYKLAGFNGYLFYSIFEWTERKNPKGLIEAFLREFQGGENVGLLIKTYFRNFGHANKRMISDEIKRIQKDLGFKKYPPIFLYKELMDRHQVMRLHQTGDCYVSPHRGEGWGVPAVEAMLAGKPVVTTAYGGVGEYLGDGVNAYLVPFEMVPVTGMNHSSFWYTHDQKWAEPNLQIFQAALRHAYENQEAARLVGQTAQGFVWQKFSLEAVGQLMADRLKQIEEAK